MDDFRPRGTHNPSASAHRGAQRSTTLNRKFVKKPVAIPKVRTRADVEREALARRRAMVEKMRREQAVQARKRTIQPLETSKKPTQPVVTKHPMVANAEAKMKARAEAARAPIMSAQEQKDLAIKRALAQMDRMDTVVEEEVIEEVIDKKRHFWQSKRFVLAISMSAVAVLLLGYFVHLNMPDISVRVAASRAGVDGSYPSYIPRGYSLDGLVAENNGKIEMTFSNAALKFTVTQEKTTWDSAALYNNFVMREWGAEAVILREHGLTIYVLGSDAVWINGGILYKIDDIKDGLTRQQLRDIAVSF